MASSILIVEDDLVFFNHDENMADEKGDSK